MHLQRVGELRAYSTQHIKWTTEGAVNRLGIILVFCNATQALTVRDMLVSCKGECLVHSNKVVPRFIERSFHRAITISDNVGEVHIQEL